MQALMLLLIVAAFVIILLGVIFGDIQQRKRLEGLVVLSRRLNLGFSAGENYGIPDRFDFLKQLAQGSNRYATNVLSGSYQQNEVLAFDYHYETESTDSKGNRTTTHHWFSFFILTLPAFFPDLTIRHESFFTKVAEVFGYEDIKFESAEFSKTFSASARRTKSLPTTSATRR
jgi:hypothetical protein